MTQPATEVAEYKPNDADVEMARDASRALSRLVGLDRVHIEAVEDNNKRTTFVLPAHAVRFLVDMLAQMAAGTTITVMPINAELTTQQAADMLNVSRPHLVKLMEAGQIRFHKVGTHRRIKFSDLIEYRRASEARRHAALDRLVEEGQELKMGY